jgi:hypothetical protein
MSPRTHIRHAARPQYHTDDPTDTVRHPPAAPYPTSSYSPLFVYNRDFKIGLRCQIYSATTRATNRQPLTLPTTWQTPSPRSWPYTSRASSCLTLYTGQYVITKETVWWVIRFSSPTTYINHESDSPRHWHILTNIAGPIDPSTRPQPSLAVQPSGTAQHSHVAQALRTCST